MARRCRAAGATARSCASASARRLPPPERLERSSFGTQARGPATRLRRARARSTLGPPPPRRVPMKLPFRPSVAVLCGVLGLAGCSSQDQSGGDTAPAAQPDASAQKLDTYNQLLRIHNDEMAVSMGHDILDHYPNSAAAKQVQQTLPAI